MGLEAQCTARLGRKVSEGKARLETEDLVFSGDFRLSIPLKQIRKADARNGRLDVTFGDGRLSLELGRQAEKWALKIRYPKGRADKLGLKPGLRVAVVGLRDPDFHRELAERNADVTPGRTKKDSDLIFYKAETVRDLDKLKALRECLKKDGALWVLWPKGVPALREDDVRTVATKVGLVDVKVVSFSDTLSALKLMIPRALR